MQTLIKRRLQHGSTPFDKVYFRYYGVNESFGQGYIYIYIYMLKTVYPQHRK